MKFEKIEESTYFKRLSEPLRTPVLSRNIMFWEKGIAYRSDRLAFLLFRPSKNNYTVEAFQPGEPDEEYKFGNLKDAIEFCINLVDLDRQSP